MDLFNALRELGFSDTETREAAQEAIYHDLIGGCDRGWPVGSLFEIEGQFLYAVTRLLKATRVIELGTYRGCSASHFLSALPIGGRLTSVDIYENCGDMIPAHLRANLEFVAQEALDYLLHRDEPTDIVFEDGPHSAAFTEQALRHSLSLNPKLIISHDAMHSLVGHEVRAGWSRVFGSDYHTVLLDGSDCGFAWKLM